MITNKIRQPLLPIYQKPVTKFDEYINALIKIKKKITAKFVWNQHAQEKESIHIHLSKKKNAQNDAYCPHTLFRNWTVFNKKHDA